MVGLNLRYMLAEVRLRRSRSFLMAGGIALGVAFLLCLNALAAAYAQASTVPMRQLGADITVQKSNGPIPAKFEGAVFPCADAIIDKSSLGSIQSASGVEQVSSALLLWVFDSGMENASDFKMVLGIDPSSEIGPGELKEGLKAGRFLTSTDQSKALVDASYAATKGIRIGDTLRMAGRAFEVVGVVTAPPASILGATNIYIPLNEAQEIASSAAQIKGYHDGDVNLVFIKADPARLSAVQDEITKDVPGATLSTPSSFLAMMGGLAAAARRLAWLGTLIAVLAAVAVAVRISASNIWERRLDIAVMRAVGWTTADCVRQVSGENLLLGLAGGVIGVVASWCFTLALGGQVVNIPLPWELDPYPHFYLTTAAEQFLKVPLAVRLSWPWVLFALALALLISLVTTLLVASRLTKIKPAEVLRYE